MCVSLPLIKALLYHLKTNQGQKLLDKTCTVQEAVVTERGASKTQTQLNSDKAFSLLQSQGALPESMAAQAPVVISSSGTEAVSQ